MLAEVQGGLVRHIDTALGCADTLYKGSGHFSGGTVGAWMADISAMILCMLGVDQDACILYILLSCVTIIIRLVTFTLVDLSGPGVLTGTFACVGERGQ